MSTRTVAEDGNIETETELMENVREEVAFAATEVAFFRSYLSEAGIRPAEINDWAMFRRIPPTTKVHYRVNFPDRIVANGWSVHSPGVTRLQSSGSEGDRLVTLAHTFTLGERMANSIKTNKRLKFLLDVDALRACRYAAPNCSDVECANPNIQKEDRMLADGTLVLSVYHDLLATPDALLDQAFDEILEYEPHYLYVDPNHLVHLLTHVQRSGRLPKVWPKLAVFCTYSFLTHSLRRRLHELLGPTVPVVNVLAMSELGFVAIECEHGQLHINSTDYYIELVDHAGEPVAPGTIGELCITTLGDRLSPKIRYMTGDLYVTGPACRCGSQFPTMIYMGRKRFVFTDVAERLITPRDLDEVVGAFEWVKQYQCTKEGGDRYSFQYIAEITPGEREVYALRDALIEVLGASARVRMHETRYIAAERSGKFLTCKNGAGENIQ